MTTAYTADQTETLNTCDDAATIIAAWSSSDLGELDNHFTAMQDDRTDEPTAGRAKLFAALAAGVIGGATVGAVLFGYQAGPPTAVVPGFGVSTSAIPAADATSNGQPSRPVSAAALPAQAPTSVALGGPDTAPAPDSVPNTAVDPGTPPVSGPPAVDVWVPPLPAFIDNKPKPQAPPEPEPPDLQPPNIVVVQTVPDADPDPKDQPSGNGSRFTVQPFPDTSKKPTGGLKPIDRSAMNPSISKKPTVQKINPSNRTTLAKP
jgi:hypothetical protein